MAMLRRILWQEPRTGRSGWLGRGNRSAGVARIDPCRGIAEGIPGMRARLLEGTRIKNMVRTRCHLSMHGSNRWYSSDTAFAGQRSHGLTVDQEPLPPGNDTTSVFVGMSGGVDSSVTALLLKQQGYKVEGVYMRNWDERDETGHCPSTQDWLDVQAVCSHLAIPCHSVDFSKDYWTDVFESFLHGYELGYTPNPDILCNKEIKFKRFLEYCLGKGADYIATGHYARIKRAKGNDGRVRHTLHKGIDTLKDQSYFLSCITEEALSKTLMPLGSLTKQNVKAIAIKANIPQVLAKKESMGVCFVGKRNLKSFLSEYLPLQRPGPFLALDAVEESTQAMGNPDEHCLGTHQSAVYYTIGQRAHLPGRPCRYYVAKKNLQQNAVYLVQNQDHPALRTVSCDVAGWSWVDADGPCDHVVRDSASVHALTRYSEKGSASADQRIRVLEDDGKGTLKIQFDVPRHAVAPGQYLVMYDEDRCLGGGRIVRTVTEYDLAQETIRC